MIFKLGPAPASTCDPPFKWPGGKRRLAPRILAEMPAAYGAYHEPFLGGGAVFFALQPERAFLSDRNPRIIRTFEAIRTHPEELIRRLHTCPTDKDYYLSLREIDIDKNPSDLEVGVWFLTLNALCFNGLYRENSSGKFNVGYGYNGGPLVFPEHIRRASMILQNATLACHGFEVACERVQAGDFVYFDPPYVPASDTANFTSYTSEGFSAADQIRLAEHAAALVARGASVIASNNANPELENVWEKHGFRTVRVTDRRSLSGKVEGRIEAAEVLFLGTPA